MTAPNLKAFTSVGSSANGAPSITLPTGIVKGDRIVVYKSGDSAGDSSAEGDFLGYHKCISDRDSGGAQVLKFRLWEKIAEGNESGLTITVPGAATDRGFVMFAAVWEGVDEYLDICFAARPSAASPGSANPTFLSASAPWGTDDNAWGFFCTGRNSSPLFSGTPVDGDAVAYSNVTHLAGLGSADACVASFGNTVRTASAEQASALTRTAEEWYSLMVGLPPARDVANQARVLNRQTRVTGASAPYDAPVTVEDGGAGVRLLALISTSVGTITDVRLDPAGLNLQLVPCFDGSVTSGQTGASCFTAWYTTVVDVPPGTYTLRITRGTGSGIATVHWVEVENTDTSTSNVYAVTNVLGTTNTGVAAGSIPGVAGDLVFMGVNGTGGGHAPSNLGMNLAAMDGLPAAPFGDIRPGTDARMASCYIGRAIAGTNNIGITSYGSNSGDSTTWVPSTSSTMLFTAITLTGLDESGPVLDDDNCFHHAA